METQSQHLNNLMENADNKGIHVAERFFEKILSKDKFGNDIRYNFETIEGTGYRFDFLATAKTDYYEFYFVVEVKLRNTNRCKKEWDDVMMEEDKWNAQFQYEEKYLPLYFSLENPKDNKNVPLSVSIFNLKKIREHLGEMRYTMTYCPERSTREEGEKEKKVWKKTYYLPKSNKELNRYYRWEENEQTFVIQR